MQEPYLDNSHTIEIAVKDITIRIRNGAEPTLLTRTYMKSQERNNGFQCKRYQSQRAERYNPVTINNRIAAIKSVMHYVFGNGTGI